ncbi:major facilitator superfamily domain-containing protein [Fusarium tricinctum]|uniref:Major facilitator superfamily domain-containing protein n=1 Tax=Fusarium tricinctum TaxID=61284 RepID=A0A8K0RPT0_9HYPO|nr:major facilitator superfamily domain-containing protein [Fusarium tricinctum]
MTSTQLVGSCTSISSEKTPAVDVESAPSTLSSTPDAGHDSDDSLESIIKDKESGFGAWSCVLGSLLFLIPSFGFMASIGTVQSYLNLNQLKDHSVSEIGWISGVYLFLSLVPTFFIGSMLYRYGPRILSPIGGVFSTATFILMAECKTYWQFMLCFGVFGSIGTSICCTTAIGVVGKLFVRRRGLAMGTAVMGTSLGSIIFPLLLRSTFKTLGWAWSMRIVALVVGCVTVLGVICFLPFQRLVCSDSTKQKDAKHSGSALDLSAWKNPAFASVSCGVFLIEFVVFGIGGLLPTISAGAGFSAEDGYTLLAILGACSCVGRLTMGLLGDRLGAVNSMISVMVLIVVFMSTIFIPFSTTSAPLLYTFTALWGFCSGSFYVLSPVCTGKTCEPKDYARYYGSSNLAVGIALLIANPVSGIMLEKLGAQPLACFYLAIVVLAGVSFMVARGLLLGNFTTLRTKV